MKRRVAVVGGVAAAAMLGGVAVAWWRANPGPPAQSSQPPIDFWTMEFDRPGGGERVTAAALRGRPLLLNFWATWCPPCVTEMPLLDAFSRRGAQHGWQVLALAVDAPPAVQRFLTEGQLALPVAMAGSEGIELSRSLGNAAGGLPYTVCFDAAGTVQARKLGPVDDAWLKRWAPPVRR